MNPRLRRLVMDAQLMRTEFAGHPMVDRVQSLRKDLPREPDLIEQAEGKAVKVISALVPYLPRRHAYRVLAMVRQPREIAHSQARMLSDSESNIEPMTGRLEKHQTEWLEFLRKAPHVCLIELNYGEVVAQPARAARAIASFLGPDLVPRVERMPSAVKPELYRNRQAAAA